MVFRDALEATPQIRECYRNGLQALGAYSIKINPGNARLCHGSVDLDSCVESLYPNDNRWDYILSYSNRVYYVEVHPANTSEIDIVIAKLNWLKDWLRQHAPGISNMVQGSPAYHWLTSNGVHILPTSLQARRLAASGIPFPKRQLNLK